MKLPRGPDAFGKSVFAYLVEAQFRSKFLSVEGEHVKAVYPLPMRVGHDPCIERLGDAPTPVSLVHAQRTEQPHPAVGFHPDYANDLFGRLRHDEEFETPVDIEGR